jgi:Coenzyme PQQ synthesis protein D (PqqD)
MSPRPCRYRLAEGVLAQTALDEAVLLDARAGAYFGANLSATVILRALLAGADEEQMLGALLAKFDADESRLRDDLRVCLDVWLKRGLIVEGP